MPDKTVTVAAYAAGASLAAISLFYVFGPTFFIDGENSYNTSDGRKRTIIGLENPANDCFINSVLQALAGLGDLRLYLIKELHRRQLDGAQVYDSLPAKLSKDERPEKIISLQQGPITKALKDMLDALNERPIYKKTITAKPLIESIERVFRTRISRNQQDAQEFFQIVAERISDEYHAAERARKRMHSLVQLGSVENIDDEAANKEEDGQDKGDGAEMTGSEGKVVVNGEPVDISLQNLKDNDGVPFEGKLESQIQCLFCGFKYKPSVSTFVSLTLNVPQKSSTTLDSCFDVLLKNEDIDDFKCDKCRLKHALEWKEDLCKRTYVEEEREALAEDMGLIRYALINDPEKPPEDVELPDSEHAPRRKIRKRMRISLFPKVVAIHLSRSVFDLRSYSTKNMAKVSYPERLRLGGILNERWYRLHGIVCHKGSHNSGHYESFRRNHVYPPFATPDAFSAYAAASRAGSVIPSAYSSPALPAMSGGNGRLSSSSSRSTPTVSSVSISNSSTRPMSQEQRPPTATSQSTRSAASKPAMPETPSASSPVSNAPVRPHDPSARFWRKKRSNDRWWRISDDKIKEARTSEVLAMQREVYLLFYELERPGDDEGL